MGRAMSVRCNPSGSRARSFSGIGCRAFARCGLNLLWRTRVWNLESGRKRLAPVSSRAALDGADEGVRPHVDRYGYRRIILAKIQL